MPGAHLCQVKDNSPTDCLTYRDVQMKKIIEQGIINMSDFQYYDSYSLILNNNELQSEYFHGMGCFYLERDGSYLKLVLMFLTRVTLSIYEYSRQYDGGDQVTLCIPMLGVCNTCDRDLIETSGNCSTYKELAVLVQGRQSICHNETVGINVRVNNRTVLINLDSFQLPTVTNVTFLVCRGKLYHIKVLQ